MNIANRDIRVNGYVLRRTNYGEADRILNLITPIGKISAIAKGVRKEKSRLAGAIELFCLTDYNLHKGNKELATVTGAKMLKYHNQIIKDFNKLELASMMLKKTNIVAEGSDSQLFFEILDQSLDGLNNSFRCELVEAWFLLNLTCASGDEINFHRDSSGKKLDADYKYNWDVNDSSFVFSESGDYGVNEIKVLRLMISNKLAIVERVKTNDEMLNRVLLLSRIIARM